MFSKRPLRRAVQALALTGLTLTLPACATITRGTTQQFTIESSPPAAQASTSSGYRCETTPCTLRMPRKDPFTVTVSKDGYETATKDVSTRMSGGGTLALIGNVIFGGIIGIVVDSVKGSTLDLTPNPFSVTLEPKAEAAPAPVSAPAAAVAEGEAA